MPVVELSKKDANMHTHTQAAPLSQLHTEILDPRCMHALVYPLAVEYLAACKNLEQKNLLLFVLGQAQPVLGQDHAMTAQPSL